MSQTLEDAAKRIVDAVDYTDVFPDEDSVSTIYRELARQYHPDLIRKQQAAFATEVFQKLVTLKNDALQMAREGRFGERPVLATIRTKKASHQVVRKVGEDTMALYYRALTRDETGAEATTVKVVKSPKDNDLMAQEAKALKKLHGTDDQLTRHFPVLLDTFLHSEGRRRANVTQDYDGFLSLQTVRERFPTGLDPCHGAWMFRRLMMALGYAHEQGLVHGAVTPDNVLIEPENHALVLVDWCYSVVIDDESKTNFIKAVVPMYKQLYAPEVFDKKPASAATDLYMAATLMSWLMPVAPKPFRAFFKGTALTSPAARPQNAWGLLKEFDDLLERIGPPFHPRRFVKFVVPSGAAS